MCANAVLELDGEKFEGKAFGIGTEASGRPAIFDGAVGLEEFITDPASGGLIVITTSPLTGNDGFNLEDMESDDCYIQGLVTRECCRKPGGWRCELELDAFLRRTGVMGLEGVDTRELTRFIRRNNTAWVTLGSERQSNLTKKVYRSKKVHFPGNGLDIALIDLGVRKSVIARLREPDIDANLTVFPAGSAFTEIMAASPDAVIISNGPGEPEEYLNVSRIITQAIKQTKVYAMGLGAVLLGQALGAETKALDIGHHSPSVTIKDTDGALYVTEQNHRHTLINPPDTLKTEFINVNDGSIEGFSGENAYGIMFYPSIIKTHSRSAALFYDRLNKQEKNHA